MIPQRNISLITNELAIEVADEYQKLLLNLIMFWRGF